MSDITTILTDADEEIDEILDALSANSDIDSETLAEFYDDLIHRLTTFRRVL